MKRTLASMLFVALIAASCSSDNRTATNSTTNSAINSTTNPTVVESSAASDHTTEAPSTTSDASGVPETQAPTTTSRADELTVGDLFLPDPTIGLAALTSYHQEMTLTVTGSTADTADTYVRDRWPGVGTSTLISTTTAAGVTELLVGDLGRSTYVRSGAGAPCLLRWSEESSPASPAIELASMLPRVVTAGETGHDTRDGLAATSYRFDARVGDATGTGELRLADDTGLLLSYSLDLVDGAATQSYRYAVTSINGLGEAVLPSGCAPVLESIPAIDGASNVQRLTAGLDYSTTASVADVVAFYEQTMPTLGWTLVGTRAEDPARPTMFFANATTAQAASIFVEVSDGATWVSVIVRDAAGSPG